MRGIAYDLNIEGHHEMFLHSFHALGLFDYWNGLELSSLSLIELGFDRDTEDRWIWNRCQSEQLVLVTTNRNDDGPDSLGRTLDDSHCDDNLPVITLANNDRFVRDRRYALLVAEKYLEMLDDIRDGYYLGTGRIYLPPHPIA